MDGYKTSATEMERNKPLLWDPRNYNYKSKDKKTIVEKTVFAKLRYVPSRAIQKAKM